MPISPYYLGQTNRAASLSSAQLVSSTGSPSSTALPLAQRQSGSGPRPVAVAERPSQPTVVKREEDEQREVQVAKPPVELEEDVEGPPADQQVEPEPVREPERPAVAATEQAAGSETDASTRAIKSDDEPGAHDGADEAATPTISISPPPEEAVVKEDVPAEELLEQQGSTGADDVDGAQEGKTDEPAKVDAAEAAESDVEEDQRQEAQDGESSLVNIKL